MMPVAPPTNTALMSQLLKASRHLSKEITALNSRELPANIVAYNVYDYAWDAWQSYLAKFATASARTLILGINPGPHGMVQTGIPFGNISTVKDWLKLNPKITRPANMHPKRPVLGLEYGKEEPSGAALWQCMRNIFGSPENFFRQYFVLNYCPVAYFLCADTNLTGTNVANAKLLGINLARTKSNAQNITPDKLSNTYRQAIEALCTQHLYQYLNLLDIQTIFAIGKYSEKKATQAVDTFLHSSNNSNLSNSKNSTITVHYITHPSPLNPKHKEFSKEFAALHRTLHG